MLGSAGDVDFGVTDEAGERAAHEGARVAGAGDVGIVQHGVAMTAQPAVVARLRLAEQRHETRALLRRDSCSRPSWRIRSQLRLNAGCSRRAPCRKYNKEHC